MPKVIGPLFSLSASGTYRKALCFRTGPNGTHVSGPISGSKTKSALQLQHTTNVSAMAKEWAALSSAEKLDWSACGVSSSMTGRALFWREWFSQSSTPLNLPIVPCA